MDDKTILLYFWEITGLSLQFVFHHQKSKVPFYKFLDFDLILFQNTSRPETRMVMTLKKASNALTESMENFFDW